MKTKALLLLLTLVSSARATFIETGQVEFGGDFTLNHLYDFNNQGAQPFGWFGTQTVTTATGKFAPYITNGNVLQGDTALWTVPSGYPQWTIQGFALATTFDSITGADSGMFCFGILNMTGNGYVQGNDSVHWEFVAPPYDIGNFHYDITGPITLDIIVGYDNGVVPDTGTTLLLFLAGLFSLGMIKQKLA